MRKELAFLAIALILMMFLARMLAVPQQIRLNKELVQLKVRGPASSVAIAKSLAGVREMCIRDRIRSARISKFSTYLKRVGVSLPFFMSISPSK